MKNVAVAVLMLLASTSALPNLSQRELRQERIINDIIIGVIEDLIERIVQLGLDPFIVPAAEVSYALSEPEIFAIDARVANFIFTGLSNIKINRLNFSVLTQTLTFDISLPKVSASVGAASAELSTFGRFYSADASGSLEIEQIRLSGTVRVSVGIISGISVRSLSLSFSLGGIDANLNLNVLDRDVSEIVNNYLSVTLPNALKESQKEINDLIEYIAWLLIDQFLDFSSLNMALQA